MTEQIPIVAFSAWSGTGKTTLIEKLITELKKSGVRLAVIKHDAHDFEIDHEGKDSWRFAKAGADITILSSARKTACIEKGSLSLKQLIGMVHDVDLILVEGYKNEELPRIGIARKETEKGFTADIDSFIAVVTDLDIVASVPHFALDDINGLADFIRRRIGWE